MLLIHWASHIFLVLTNSLIIVFLVASSIGSDNDIFRFLGLLVKFEKVYQFSGIWIYDRCLSNKHNMYSFLISSFECNAL